MDSDDEDGTEEASQTVADDSKVSQDQVSRTSQGHENDSDDSAAKKRRRRKPVNFDLSWEEEEKQKVKRSKHRQKRCGKCEACLTPECGKCDNCRLGAVYGFLLSLFCFVFLLHVMLCH